MRIPCACAAAISALVLALPAPAAAEISFVPPAPFPAPDAQDVISGDFNRDGLLDVAVTNRQQASMSVLLGDGQANLGPASSFTVPGHPADLGAADFDNDGNPDLAVTGQETGNVTMWPGGGNGNFGPSYDVQAAPSADRLAVGDLTNDLKPDLVVTNGSGASVDVLVGDGAGTFATPVAYGVSSTALDVALGDLNGDGKLDIVSVGGAPGTVSVLLGNGDGSFGAEIPAAVGGAALAVALTDYNRDQVLDVVVGLGSSGVVFLAGDGTGQFRAKQNVAVPGSTVSSVAAGDLDRDGDPDVALSNPVATIESNGDGTLRPAVSHNGQGLGLTIADLDGDSMNDLVLAAAQNVVVLGNNSTPPLPAPVVAKSANAEPVRGTVLIKVPGRRGFVRLEEADNIPIGSQLDTRRGTVRLTTAAGRGATQSGRFRGGLFKLKQKKVLHPFTVLQLTGKLGCRRSHGPVRSSAKRPRSRRLFGNAHGRFRTRGRNSVASIRGTRWLVKDTCSTTLTVAQRGTVVVRDLVKNRTVTLKTGQRYVARSA